MQYSVNFQTIKGLLHLKMKILPLITHISFQTHKIFVRLRNTIFRILHVTVPLTAK